MTPAYKQYLRAYTNVLSDGLVKCDLMSPEGLDVAAVALGVLHAKRAIHRPQHEAPLNAMQFAEALSALTFDADVIAAAC